MYSFLSSPRFLAALVALLLVLSFIPTADGFLLERLFYDTGLGRINQTAQNYLEVQGEQALKGFLLLSALKVGLAVLRSSEVGFILNVKVGDLAIAAYDYVDFGWKVLLAAVAYFYIAEYLMTLASVVNIWFLWVALVSILAWLLVLDSRPGSSGLRTVFSRTGMTGSILAILLYIGLPLGFVGAGWVSAHITGEPISAANELYENMGDSMPSLLDDREMDAKGKGVSNIGTLTVTVPVPYDGTDPSLAITEGPEYDGSGIFTALISGEKLKEFKEYLQQRSKALASAVLRQTASYIFNIAVFPLLMIIAFYLLSKYLIGLMFIK